MHKRILIGAWLLVAVPGAAGAAATPAISIDALVADIVANNAERRFYEGELAAARVAVRAAGRLADPELAVEFGQKRTTEPNGQQFGAGASYSLALTQPLEFNGRVALRRAIAEQDVRLAELGYRQFRATLAARARTLAYTLFTASAKADMATAAAARLTGVARVVVQRDPAGPSPLIEARILEAGALTAQMRARGFEADYNSALYELNQLRGAPFAAHVRLTLPVTTLPPLPPIETLTERARTENFEIRSLQAQLEQQGLRVDLARRGRVGQVTVGPYYRSETASTTDRFVGVHVAVPLPLWNAQAGQVATEQGRALQAQSALLVQVRTIERQLFEQASLYNERLRSVNAMPADGIARFREAADLADRNYRMGAVPVATYVEAQRQYVDAATAILDARRDAQAALLQVQVLTGAGDTP